MRKEYNVSFNMAVEIVYKYLERIYQVNKHKGTSIAKAEELFDLNIELKGLVDQLREDGHDIDQLIREKKQTLNVRYLYDKLEINIDGSVRGVENPNKDNLGGVVYSIKANGEIIHEGCISLGTSVRLPKLKNEPYSLATEAIGITSNVAEYMALILTLEYLLDNEITAQHIEIFSDAERVVYQVNKTNSTRTPQMLRLRDCVWELMDEFDNITLTYIPREKNDHVDWVLCQFLDNIEGIKRDRETRRIIRETSLVGGPVPF